MLLTIANMILGPTGISIILCGVAGTFVGIPIGLTTWRNGIYAFSGGVGAFVVAAIIRQVLSAGAVAL